MASTGADVNLDLKRRILPLLALPQIAWMKACLSSDYAVMYLNLRISSLFVCLQSTTRIPYMACFFLFARRSTSNPDSEAVLHLICLTEPERADHLLELREDFVEVMRTDYVEIYDKNEIAARKERQRNLHLRNKNKKALN